MTDKKIDKLLHMMSDGWQYDIDPHDICAAVWWYCQKHNDGTDCPLTVLMDTIEPKPTKDFSEETENTIDFYNKLVEGMSNGN
jgi:hypothetical protein